MQKELKILFLEDNEDDLLLLTRWLKKSNITLIGYSNIMQEDYGQKLDEEGRGCLQSIVQNGSKMSIMIDDLLKFSRLGRKEIEKAEIDMESLVKKSLDEVNDSTKHKANVIIHKLSDARGDYSLLSHVWVNLLSNAIKYSGKKENPEVEIGCEEKEDKVVYYVKDNGAGFDMAYANKLFGVFQRLHTNAQFEGIGIGLAIVQRIITRHGGKVWAEGTPGKGATFYFSLHNV